MLKKKKDYVFILKAKSGNILLSSIAFKNINEAKKTVNSLNTLHEKPNVFERKTNHKGKFIFNLKKHDGEVIGTSQSYSSEVGMENGIKNVKKSIKYLSDLKEL